MPGACKGCLEVLPIVKGAAVGTFSTSAAGGIIVVVLLGCTSLLLVQIISRVEGWNIAKRFSSLLPDDESEDASPELLEADSGTLLMAAPGVFCSTLLVFKTPSAVYC